MSTFKASLESLGLLFIEAGSLLYINLCDCFMCVKDEKNKELGDTVEAGEKALINHFHPESNDRVCGTGLAHKFLAGALDELFM